MLASPNSRRRRRNCGLRQQHGFSSTLLSASDRARSPGAFAGGGVSCFFRRGQQDVAALLGFAVVDRGGSRRLLPWPGPGWLWWSTGLLFPALPLNSPTYGSSSRPATPATSSCDLPQKGKHPGNPVQTRCRRCRAAPGGAGGSRGGRCRWPCLPGRTPAQPRSCRLSPCGGGEGRRKELCQTLMRM